MNTAYNVSFTLKSRNAKTGPIPVSTTTAATCPTSCPFQGDGCYAENYPLKGRWNEVTDGRRGTNFAEFLPKIAALPDGQLWRHNQAGDLPGIGDEIDTVALAQLVAANAGRRGFTYTHKPMSSSAAMNAIANANNNGFTVNLSANNLAHADELAALAIAPVVVVLPATTTGNQTVTTPEGRRVVVCPATYRDDVTCASCGLCAKQRAVIVGFPAHGTYKRKASAIAA